MKTRPWVDAHSHIADPRWDDGRSAMLTEALSRGLGFFLQGGVGPEDWARQKELKKQHPEQIGLCFGVHPYWVADHTQEELEAALDALVTALPEALALGELGLDFRPSIMKDSQELQYQAFIDQLELADVAQKPVVLHLVQAHDEALRVFNHYGVPRFGAMVHSFNGSAHKANELLKKGFMLSVGGPVCRPENKKLHQAVLETPLEYLLLESDSPDQPPPQYKGQNNPSYSVLEVARAIGQIKSLDPHEILDITTANFWRWIQGKNEETGF